MAKFCGKCGSRLNESTGLCPNCDAERLKQQMASLTGLTKEDQKGVDSVQHQDKVLSKKEIRKIRRADKKATKKAKKKENRSKLTTSQKIKRFFIKLFAVVLALLILAGGIAGTLVYFKLADIPYVNDVVTWVLKQKQGEDISVNLDSKKDKYIVETINAEEYFANNSTVISSVEVEQSSAVKTEADAYKLLTSLGFCTFPITTEYSIDGTYYGAVSINETSSERHPVYQTYYVTENGEIWTILLIGDVIMANPVSYNVQINYGVSVMFSETKYIISYDSATNTFYETIPNKSSLVVKIVEEINSDTLENLTIEVINGYE